MSTLTSLYVYLLVVTYCQVVFGSGWSYDSGGHDGPSHWSESYADCGGSNQSPIDIVLNQVTSGGLGQMTFQGWDVAPPSMTLTNNGHSAQVNCEYEAFVSGGGLPATYKVKQFHFHWGSTNTQGSEHTIDGGAFPLEMHIVMYNTDMGTFDNAANQPQGLAVLAVLFNPGSSLPSAYNTITSNLGSVINKGDEVTLTPFALSGLLPDTNSFKRYSGSLTTPGCYESVVWTVLDSRLAIDDTQIAAFRALKYENGEALVNNYRPTQPLNSRSVLQN